MSDIVTGLGINIFGTGYTGGVGQTGLVVSVANNALKVDCSSFTQPIIGTGIAGTPAAGVVSIQGISGMVPLEVAGSFTAIPTGTQEVSGTVSINGTVTATLSGTQSITGTGTAGTNYTTGIVTIQGSTAGVALPVSVKDSLTGFVHQFNTSDVTASSSGTVVTYGVVSGSFVLKGIQSSSSAGPVKIIVKVANALTTTTLSVGFFSSANPFVNFDYPQGYVVSSGSTVQVVGFNNAVADQTIYGSINGLNF